MPLAQDLPDFRYVPRGIGPAGGVLINDRELTTSFAVGPDVLIEDWPATRAGALTPELLEPLLARQPAVLLLGTGRRQVFPPALALATALRRGVGLEVMDNAAAARTFAVLAGEGRKVLAAFLLPGD
jgi:uncharacterized protein